MYHYQKQPPKQDIMKLFSPEDKPFIINSTPIAHSHTINIDEEFTHVSQFAELVDILEQASENDIVQIRLTSPGGNVASVLPLLSALDSTEAFVHVHVDSDIASAATFLVMKAHMVTMNKHISMMIHTASWGYGGHSGNMEASTNHYVKNVKGLARDVYQDFLTEQEFDRVFDGLELWFTPEQVYERLKARAEKQQAKAEKPADETSISDEELLKFVEQNPSLFEEESPKPQKQKRIKVPNTKKSVVE